MAHHNPSTSSEDGLASLAQPMAHEAEERSEQLQVQLKSLIVADPADPIWTANLVPSTSVQEAPNPSDLDTLVTQGRLNRPEVRQAEDKRLSADIDRAFALNQSLPQADLQMQYLSNGFAGVLTPFPAFLLNECANGSPPLTTCPTPPPNTQGKMAWAYHNMWAGYFPMFNIALIVSYPIEGRLARGMRGVSSEEMTQAKLILQGVEQRIGAEARDALQSVEQLRIGTVDKTSATVPDDFGQAAQVARDDGCLARKGFDARHAERLVGH